MFSLSLSPSIQFRLVLIASVFLSLLAYARPVQAESAYVRVNQAGYEAGETSFRAYLMSTAAESGASFKVVNSEGVTAFSGRVGSLLGTWSHSKIVTYDVYALDFKVPGGNLYTISVSGPEDATSPQFAVDDPDALYSGLLLNTLFFYETQRDGPNFIPNACETISRLRWLWGHDSPGCSIAANSWAPASPRA